MDVRTLLIFFYRVEVKLKSEKPNTTLIQARLTPNSTLWMHSLCKMDTSIWKESIVQVA